jgi:hypothetical protein
MGSSELPAEFLERWRWSRRKKRPRQRLLEAWLEEFREEFPEVNSEA